jgi:hypothetical protein
VGGRLTRSQIGFLWAVVMPVIALFVIIRVIPILVVLLMSFTNYNLNRPLVRFLPYQNFLRLFGDPNFVTAFVNSTEFVLVAVPLEICLGLAFGLFRVLGLVQLVLERLRPGPAAGGHVKPYFDHGLSPETADDGLGRQTAACGLSPSTTYLRTAPGQPRDHHEPLAATVLPVGPQ